MFTTRPNPFNFDEVAVLKELGRPAIRLHPRRTGDLPHNISKIGGRILWPRDEPLPICPEHRCPAVPVLQLFKADCPVLPFPGANDLFQLLWYPQMYDDCGYQPKLDLRWWDSKSLDGIAEPDYVNHDGSFEVEECQIFPEKIMEYPDCDQMTDEQWDAIEELVDNSSDYSTLWSTCPGTKIGGYPQYGGQDPWTPSGESGNKMTYLLTISDDEWDRASAPRWMPIEQDHPPAGEIKLEKVSDTETQINIDYSSEEEAALSEWTDEKQRQYEDDCYAIGTCLKNPLNVFIDSPWTWKTA